MKKTLVQNGNKTLARGDFVGYSCLQDHSEKWLSNFEFHVRSVGIILGDNFIDMILC